MSTFRLFFLIPILTAFASAQQTQLWVDAVNGDDSNAGTRAAPFKSITKGVSVGTLNATIHVLPGTYSPSNTNEVFTIEFTNGHQNVQLIGEDPNTCIVDFEQLVASNNHWYFLIDSGAKDIEIANLRFMNGAFQPAVQWYSAAFWWRDVDGLNLHNCYIESCESGLYSAGGAKNVSVHDNVFLDNNIPCRFRQKALNGGGNCRFYNNLVANSTGFYSDTVSPSADDPTQVFVNNIIINNAGDGMAGGFPAGMIVENNDCFNNGGTNYNLATAVSGSNLSVDPELVDFANGDYRLKPSSPCIEAGYPAGQPGMVNDFYGNARASDHDGNFQAVPDIGVHELPGVRLSVTNFAQAQTAFFQLDAVQTGVTFGYLFISFDPTPATLHPFGTIGMNLAPGVSIMYGGGPVTVPSTTPIPIPPLPFLNDVPVYFQAFGIATNFSYRPSGRIDKVL